MFDVPGPFLTFPGSIAIAVILQFVISSITLNPVPDTTYPFVPSFSTTLSHLYPFSFSEPISILKILSPFFSVFNLVELLLFCLYTTKEDDVTCIFCVTIDWVPGIAHLDVGISSKTGITKLNGISKLLSISLYVSNILWLSVFAADTFCWYWCQYKSPSLSSTSNFCKYSVDCPYWIYSFAKNSAPPSIAFSGLFHPCFLAYANAFFIIAELLLPDALTFKKL